MKRLMEQLGNHFIGLWRYRIYGERRYYICTFDYDSRQRVTPEGALREALKTLKAERKKRESKNRA